MSRYEEAGDCHLELEWLRYDAAVFAIGVAKPLSVNVETFGTGQVDDDTIAQIINEHFDLRPGAIIRDLDLRRPIYRKTAAYGHFGREDADFTWEKTNKAEELREAAGLKPLADSKSEAGSELPL